MSLQILFKELCKASQPILTLPRLTKRVIAISVDISLCILTVWLAFYLRLGDFVALAGTPLIAGFISIIFAIPIFITFGLYRAIFRYSGWSAMIAVAQAVGIYGLLYASVITAIGFIGIPRTVGLIQPLLLFLSIGCSRLFVRFWLGGSYRSGFQKEALPKALIYGAGSAGRQLVSALENSFEMRAVGFLDDDDRLQGHSLNGQPIFAPVDLPGLIASKGITHVLLAISSANRHRRNEILKKIGEHPVAVRTLPSLTDLAEGRVTTTDIQELDVDDLLGREVVAPSYLQLTKHVKNKVVLVTGAGGSIGSELSRQIITLSPKLLLLLDISEFSLYSIHNELEDIKQHHSDIESLITIPIMGSVQDRSRMRDIMKAWNPDTIYHSAAYKHVPLVEYNITEGIKNNVIGTLVTAQAAIENGVANFVFISTDKAVRPTNIMGAGKRLAEICVQSLFSYKTKSTVSTCLSMVRFGNVLDSSGSVIPKFRQQIHQGGPVTLTHPEVNRYFMTIPEAAQLVIQAGAMANGGDVFVLDMGAPVKIGLLAKRMIVLSGLSVRDRNNPDGDIEIQITGLRPGEKLFEELLLGDDPLPTQHPKIHRAQDPFIPWESLRPQLEKLEAMLEKNDVSLIIDLLQKLVGGYKPNENVVDWIHCARVNQGGKTGRLDQI